MIPALLSSLLVMRHADSCGCNARAFRHRFFWQRPCLQCEVLVRNATSYVCLCQVLSVPVQNASWANFPELTDRRRRAPCPALSFVKEFCRMAPALIAQL